MINIFSVLLDLGFLVHHPLLTQLQAALVISTRKCPLSCLTSKSKEDVMKSPRCTENLLSILLWTSWSFSEILTHVPYRQQTVHVWWSRILECGRKLPNRLPNFCLICAGNCLIACLVACLIFRRNLGFFFIGDTLWDRPATPELGTFVPNGRRHGASRRPCKNRKSD
jgi:hypothetical protein